MNGETLEFKYAPGMRIDTYICTVGLEHFTFGDCLKLVNKNKRLSREIESLEEQIETLKERFGDQE
jgi:hypothetical protein